ncbi:hypothetical protein [Arthrospira platensis]|uniref:Tubulin-like protein n=1 Tax=Limnospira platensis NIES-46 TaxID=1236695 RepID=A0A5M3T3A2_LIMPL|nr:hypothetical protein [Arthrospira platensis]AMW27454.1 hypothetical protein AP285_05120 [Arthrospira platensis YZ]MBD2668037.1 hypothetical protein [Arthrospira platensis FACHB-439]MBD2709946.1 hypothetical protein [Arthrospira platensis FACHB-835]MDF2210968.1 hypothetical protein [Arthrospira platensis NCB002]MDT9182470.1 hypothetical protein [Limnospira sp. PMC 289.06]QQW30212.1 hypothetical protein AP9108_05415 [Arthrospira sp. PCC 9108]BAI88991.1 hypothetical protein NIES39_C01210 [Ar
MTAYIIAIGGTGAKLVESMIHAAAVGLFSHNERSEDLQILLIDPDTGNGNASATNNTRKIYQDCHQHFNVHPSRPWMSSKIDPIQGGAWSVFERTDATLEDAFPYSQDEDEKKLLFDVLYPKEERDLHLTKGFKGRPAIGAAIISQLTQQGREDANWDALIQQINADSQGGNSPKVFLCGSIFGGTGAAGLPTLGRLLANKLGPDGENLLGKIKFGCLLLLPYFQFHPTQDYKNEKVLARSQDFILQTEAALRYYANQTELKFDSVYMLGLPRFSSVEKFSPGGNDQRNPPHFLEFYGALALRDFLVTDKPAARQVMLLSRENPEALTWSDIPEFNLVRSRVVAATRFAFAWLAAIAPDLEHARDKPKQVAWSLKFFRPRELRDEQDHIKAISDWCTNYLQWLGAIGRSEPSIKWFNWEVFLDKNGSLKEMERNDFSNLVPDDKTKEINDILSKLNPRDIDSPNNRGAIGLAKSLYKIIIDRDL